MMQHPFETAVVVPCFDTRDSILNVLSGIPSCVQKIYVVDDACPKGTGDIVRSQCQDPRVKVLSHTKNQGVGGAMVTGYTEALKDGAQWVVKIDGDGQMDPGLIPQFLKPLREGKADYVKGNRFFSLDLLASMPRIRKVGNAILSFVNKATSGYWDIMDPTNGYTAIAASVLRKLKLSDLERGYFFESDMLVQLGLVRAVVWDLPMKAEYGQETSHLRIRKIMADFPILYIHRFFKRLFYNYFLHDFNAGSFQIVMAAVLMGSGILIGAARWVVSSTQGIPATSGTVMVAALPVILGFQSFLGAINFDVGNVPRSPLHSRE